MLDGAKKCSSSCTLPENDRVTHGRFTSHFGALSVGLSPGLISIPGRSRYVL